MKQSFANHDCLLPWMDCGVVSDMEYCIAPFLKRFQLETHGENNSRPGEDTKLRRKIQNGLASARALFDGGLRANVPLAVSTAARSAVVRVKGGAVRFTGRGQAAFLAATAVNPVCAAPCRFRG